MSAVVQLKSQPLLLEGQGDLQVIYKNKEPGWRHGLLLDLRYSTGPILVSAPDWHLLHLEMDYCAVTPDCCYKI